MTSQCSADWKIYHIKGIPKFRDVLNFTMPTKRVTLAYSDAPVIAECGVSAAIVGDVIYAPTAYIWYRGIHIIVEDLN